ncbi:MAG: hypothetical protein AAFX05_11945 [Planctomycetota bacterium]
MDALDRPYLTVVLLPEGMSRQQAATVLAASGVTDEVTAYQRLAKEPPMILGQFDPGPAHRAAIDMIKVGGDAMCITLDDLVRVGETRRIKDLRIGHGGIEYDLWRGEGGFLAFDAMKVLVRARLRSTTSRPVDPGPNVGFNIGGPLDAGVDFDGSDAGATNVKTTHLSDKLDIHAYDGSVYQIDGDKFGYGVLGELRGHSDGQNMDQMCELLHHLASHVIVDDFYSLFKPPPGYHRMQLPRMKLQQEDPGFAFYSRWTALVYRHVMGSAT